MKWRRRHPRLSEQSRAATDLIVAAACVTPGMRVLDIACGNGEPSLELADRVGSIGQVTSIDLSPPMIAEARERARERQLTNVTFQVGEAESLSFEDGCFAAVTCRFGIMYVWDPDRVLSEAARVLTPHGRAAFIVWGPPEESPLFLNWSIASTYADPPPCEDVPNRFRFARPGTLSTALERAGFIDVVEEKHGIPWPTRGSLEEIQASAPFHELIDALPEPQRELARREVLATMRNYCDGVSCSFTASVILVAGRRPS